MHPAGAFGKVKADLEAARMKFTEADIRRKLDELEAMAREEIQNGG